MSKDGETPEKGRELTDRQMSRVLKSTFRLPETSVKLKVCCSVYILLMEGSRHCCVGTEVRHQVRKIFLII